MIAYQAVEVFVKYDGDSDALDRVATPQEQLLLSAGTVNKIEEIILRLSLSESGKASAAYTEETARLVSGQSIEPSALALLRNFVAKKHGLGGVGA